MKADPMSKKILLAVFLTGSLCLVSACNDEDECVNCPGDEAPVPTMANIWPHADGTAWTFDLEYLDVVPAPDNPVKENEIPTMEELHAALQIPIQGDVAVMGEGLYRIALDGMVTTQSGAEGQNVVQTFYLEMPDVPAAPVRVTRSGVDPALAMIARARPDLRPALESRYGLEAKSLEDIGPPFFLGGYAFAFEDSGYYGYADVDTNHSWVYLEGDLSVGSEFSLQLVPALADDIWLHGRIWSVGERSVGGRTFENVLECMYLMDFGEQEITNEDGDILGTFFPYNYGTTFYAPDWGPVSAIERHVASPPEIQEGPRPILIEYVMDLVGVTFPE